MEYGTEPDTETISLLDFERQGEPISFDTIWDSIEKMAISNHPPLVPCCRVMMHLSDGDRIFGDWKSWLVNDVRFRVHLNEKELAGGCFTVNHELVLFFPRQATWDVPLEFYYTDDKKWMSCFLLHYGRLQAFSCL